MTIARELLPSMSKLTGKRFTMLNATVVPPMRTPKKFMKPEKNTAGVGLSVLV